VNKSSTKPILITSYVNPDLDGVASMVAYAEFLQTRGTNAVAGIIGEPQVEAEYVLRRFGIVSPVTIPSADAFDEVILVDASNLSDLEGTIAVEKVIEIVDHRTTHEAGRFPNAALQIELVGATATLIAEKFMHENVALSREAAVLLCGGIISNTLNFKGSMTTDRDRDAFAWLNRVAQLSELFWRQLFVAKSDVTGEALSERIQDDFSWFVLNGTRVGIAEIELIGARAAVDGRGEEMIRVLEIIKDEKMLDHIFLNIIELEEPQSYIVAHDASTQQLLHDALRANFDGDVAELPRALMRKQMVPLLEDVLR